MTKGKTSKQQNPAGKAKAQAQPLAARSSFDPTEKAILHSLGWAIFIGLTFLAIGWNWTEISTWLYHAVGHAPATAHGATHAIIQVASR